MANTLQLTVNVLAKNVKQITDLTTRIEKLNRSVIAGTPRTQQFGRGVEGVGTATKGSIPNVEQLTYVLSRANRQLANVSGNFITSAASLQTFFQTIRVAEGDVAAASASLDRLLKLTVDLVGIDTRDLIQFYGRLRAVGVEAERAETILRGVTNAVAEQGKSVAVTRRILEQGTQALSAQRIVYEDFRTIVRELPTAFKVASDVVGETVISIEEFREAAQATIGEGEAVVRFFERLAETSQGADLDSFNAQWEIFRDLLFVVSAEIGKELLPTLTRALKQVNSWLEAFRELNPAIKAAIGVFTLAATGLTGLGVAVGGVTIAVGALNTALIGLTGAAGLAGLAAVVTPLLPILGVGAGLTGTALAAGYAINKIAELSDPANRAIIEITESSTAAEMALEKVRAKAAETGNALQRVSQATATQIQSAPGGIDVNADVFGQLRAGALQAGSGATVVVPETSVQDVAALTAELYNMARAAVDVREHIQGLSEAQGALNDFWQVASGQTEDYAASVEIAIPSVVELKNEQKALSAVFEDNLKTLSLQQNAYGEYGDTVEKIFALYGSYAEDAEGLANSLKRVALSTDAHNAALVNPKVSEAVGSFREYSHIIGDVNLAYEKVVPITQDFADGLGRQRSAMDEFSRSLEHADENLDRFFNRINQQGSDALDTFNQNIIDTTRVYIPGLNKELNLTQQELEELQRRYEDTTPDVLQSALENLDAITLDNLIGEFSRLDGIIGELGTKIGQFDVQGLASGNPASIATLPLQVYNAFTFDQRQADARLPSLHRQNQAAFERGEFGIPPDLLEFGREQIANALAALAETGFSELEASIGALDPVIGKTSLDEVAALPDRIIETIQTFTGFVIEGLQGELDQAKSNLAFAQQSEDVAGVQAALQEVIEANTALYQTQIDSYNLQREATGRAVGNVDELNRILNELNNEVRLQLESPALNIQSILNRQAEARAAAERTGTDRQYTEDIARSQYGSSFYEAELAVAEQFHNRQAIGEEALSKRLQEITQQREETLLDISRSYIEQTTDAYRTMQQEITQIMEATSSSFEEDLTRARELVVEWNRDLGAEVIQRQRTFDALPLQQQIAYDTLTRSRQLSQQEQIRAAEARFNQQIAPVNIPGASQLSEEQILNRVTAALPQALKGFEERQSAAEGRAEKLAGELSELISSQGSFLEQFQGSSIEIVDAIGTASSEISERFTAVSEEFGTSAAAALTEMASGITSATGDMASSLNTAAGAITGAANSLSSISINVNVVGGDGRTFHNPIHDHIALQAGQRGGQSTQRRQFLQQSADDAAAYYERGREQTLRGSQQNFPPQITIINEIPVSDEVIRAVTRGIIETQDDGSNWQFVRS